MTTSKISVLTSWTIKEGLPLRKAGPPIRMAHMTYTINRFRFRSLRLRNCRLCRQNEIHKEHQQKRRLTHRGDSLNASSVPLPAHTTATSGAPSTSVARCAPLGGGPMTGISCRRMSLKTAAGSGPGSSMAAAAWVVAGGAMWAGGPAPPLGAGLKTSADKKPSGVRMLDLMMGEGMRQPHGGRERFKQAHVINSGVATQHLRLPLRRTQRWGRHLAHSLAIKFADAL